MTRYVSALSGAIATLLAAATPLHGQAPACTPTGAPRTVARSVTLGASMPPAPLLAAYPDAWLQETMDKWSAALTPPAEWLPSPPGDTWAIADDPSGLFPFIPNGQYVVRLKRDGRVDRIMVERTSGSAALDSAVTGAFRRVDDRGGFGTLPDQLLRSRVEWRVTVGATHPLGRDPVAFREDTIRAMAVDTAPVLLHRQTSFIGAMTSATAGSGFVVEYVVTREGRVDPATVRVLWASSKSIAKEAIKSAKSSAYRPGIAGGCAVPVAVVWRQQLGSGPYDPSTAVSR
jgi:hypothetical protein